MFLEPDELVTLTGRTQNRAQARALRMMGIEHRVRPNGTIVVLSEHVAVVLGAQAAVAARDVSFEPDWRAMNAAKA
ncbi:MAG: hypothetical protein BGP02_00540 [Pandoraea sp. 64-18]|nr:MAG: hypothetical protein BGP02_00540 [Pandoraea sp. 64-18]